MAEIINITIRDEFITLGQLLKIADLISSGGETRAFLASHSVTVNDEKEDRRGRKLYKGDLVRIESRTYEIC
ncbi:MAG: S4 domain-containing protein YaaA [Erysipelotrichaceae bacterium]|nr:S4 domain-containing protein YaaA [Erysipelotrichaceae bacterium]